MRSVRAARSLLNAYKTAKKENSPLCIPVYPCVSLCIPVYPCVSLCIPMYPHAFPRPRHYPFSAKRETGKVSADFAGISQGFHRHFLGISQGFRGIIRQEILSLFSKKGKNKREKGKVSGDLWGVRRDFAGISCEEILSLFSEKGKIKGKKGKRGGVVDMSYRRLAPKEKRLC